MVGWSVFLEWRAVAELKGNHIMAYHRVQTMQSPSQDMEPTLVGSANTVPLSWGTLISIAINEVPIMHHKCVTTITVVYY